MHRSVANHAGQDKPASEALSGSAGSLIPVRGAQWRRSSWSANNGNCVEVAALRGGNVGVRDSKDPYGQVLSFSRDTWQSFVNGVRAGNRQG